MPHSPRPTRRTLLRSAAAVSFTAGMSPWFRLLAEQAEASPRSKSCILLWMGGGPSQFETLDPKPGKSTGGPTQSIATSVPGIRISEHLPQLAKQTQRLSLIRSMSTKEGDHQRATYVAQTGRIPQGPIAYPAMGAFVSKELGGPDDLPHYVSVGRQRFFGLQADAGFLGPEYVPLVVGQQTYSPAAAGSPQPGLQVANLVPGAPPHRMDARWKLLEAQQRQFGADRPDLGVRSHRAALKRARGMIEGRARAVLDVSSEPEKLRKAYGAGPFGQGCLLARKLVEAGVSFIEVSLNGWDTHQNNFDQSKQLCQQLDAGWATLLDDLHQRGLLDTTLVVWMGEFGRTPQINSQNGRDHYPRAWSAAMAGAGYDGGRVVGKTSEDGTEVDERAVSAGEMLATICQRLDLDITRQNMSNVGRPIRLVDPDTESVKELL